MARPKQTGARKATQYRAKAIQQEQAFDPRKSRNTAQYDTYDSVMDGDEDQCASLPSLPLSLATPDPAELTPSLHRHSPPQPRQDAPRRRPVSLSH